MPSFKCIDKKVKIILKCSILVVVTESFQCFDENLLSCIKEWSDAGISYTVKTHLTLSILYRSSRLLNIS